MARVRVVCEIPCGGARDVGEGPLSASDGPQDLPAHGLRGNSAASERSAETSSAEIGLLRESRRNSQTSAPARHCAQISGRPPVIRAASNVAAERKAEHLTDVGRVERPHDHLPASLVEGAVVAVQRLHHRQVGSDEEEEYGFAAEQAVPCPLEHALEGVDAVHEIRDLVDDDHARTVVGQDLGEQPERRVPLSRGLLREQFPLRQSGSSNGVEQLCQLVLRRAARRGEEEVRRPGTPEELLDEAGLADPPPAPHEDALTWLRRSDGLVNRLEGVAEHVQLRVPPDESAHAGDSRERWYRQR